jgi:hypothetical protein
LGAEVERVCKSLYGQQVIFAQLAHLKRKSLAIEGECLRLRPIILSDAESNAGIHK